MAWQLADGISSTQKRLNRNERLRLALLAGSGAIYISLVLFLLWLAAGAWALTALAAIVPLLLLLPFWRKLLHLSTLGDACSFLDHHFNTKDRITSYCALTGASGPSEWNELKKRFLEQQLAQLVPSFTAETLLPFQLSRRERCFTLAAPLSWALVLTLHVVYLHFHPPLNAPEVRMIEQLLDSGLPQPVETQLERLADALRQNELNSQEVKAALERAENELDAARQESGETLHEGKSGEPAVKGKDSRSLPPQDQPPRNEEKKKAPTPTPPPADPKTSQQQQQQQKEQEQKQKQKTEQEQKQDGKNSEQQGQQQQEQQQSGGGQSGQQQQQQKKQSGDGEGEGEGQGKGDGGSGQKEGGQQGENKEGQKGAGQGQAGQGQEQGQDNKQQAGGQGSDQKQEQGGENKGSQDPQGEGRGGSQQQDQGEKQEGSKGNAAGDSLSQTQQALEDLRQKIEGQQPQDKPGQNKGNQQGQQEQQQPGQDQKQPGAGRPGPGKKGQPEQQQDRTQDQNPSGKGQQQSSASAEDQRKNNSSREPEPDDRNQDPDQQARGSSLAEGNLPTRYMGDEDGEKHNTAEGKTSFHDEEIRSKEEPYDERYGSREGRVTKKTGGAPPKTDIADVKLARPETVKERGDQPIPLEYKDILR